MEISPGSLSSHVAATPRTSTGLCDICSHINIESLSSPDGFPHFYHKEFVGNFCRLCYEIFAYGFHAKMDDTPVRIKLFQGQTNMGLETFFLMTEEGTRKINTGVSVVAREGRIFGSLHRR